LSREKVEHDVHWNALDSATGVGDEGCAIAVEDREYGAIGIPYHIRLHPCHVWDGRAGGTILSFFHGCDDVVIRSSCAALVDIHVCRVDGCQMTMTGSGVQLYCPYSYNALVMSAGWFLRLLHIRSLVSNPHLHWALQ